MTDQEISDYIIKVCQKIENAEGAERLAIQIEASIVTGLHIEMVIAANEKGFAIRDRMLYAGLPLIKLN